MKGLYRYKAVAVANYDGDSLTCHVDLGMNTWLLDKKVRLYGIDTPELRGESDVEKALAVIARDLIEDQLSSDIEGVDKEFVLESRKDETGKYGRLLALAHVPQDDGSWLCLNDMLIDMKLAQPYFGQGDRVTWPNWFAEHRRVLQPHIIRA